MICIDLWFSRALEHEQQNYLQLVENIAQDLIPLGKLQSETNNDANDSDADADDASDGTHLFLRF